MAGYLVQVFPGEASARARLPSGPVETAVTDEEGEYELTLWESGKYHFMAGTQPDRLASLEPVWIAAGEEEVDFHLIGSDIRGVVVDAEGVPVPDAVVRFDEDSNFRFQRSAEDGTFAFPIDSLSGLSGRVLIFAEKEGWGTSETVTVVISDDGPPGEPLVLVLTDANLLRGRVLSARGEPIPGVWVGSFKAVAGRAPRMTGSVFTDRVGAFEVARARGERSELFLSGPSCPLTSFQVLREETESLELRCPSAPATLDLTLTSPEGAPLGQQELILRRNDFSVVPREVLRTHLALLGLPSITDGAGHLALVSVMPGRYDLYLAAGANADTVAERLPHGYLTSVDLVAAATIQLEVIAEAGLP